MNSIVSGPFVRLRLFVALLLAAPALFAQSDKPNLPPAPSRFEIYAGYGYLHPIDSGISGHQYPSIENLNATLSATYFFSKHFGAEIQGSYFSDNTTHRTYQICSPDYRGILRCQQDQDMQTAMGGLVFRAQKGRWIPYGHVLAGEQSQDGPVVNPDTVGFAFLGGAGVDYILPIFGNHIALRPIEADLQYGVLHYGPLVSPANISGGSAGITDVKLSAGLVARFGAMGPKVPVMLSCAVNPAAVYPGEPVMLQGTATGLNQKGKTSYRWASAGGKVVPGPEGASTATLDTTGLAAGDYKVMGHVSQGERPYQQADCGALVTVRAYGPPSISCTADPAVVMAGSNVTITSVATSPQNRGLTFSYTSTMGSVQGTGATAQLSTAGQQPGTAQISCNVTDDLGQTATAQTSVAIGALPAPPVKAVQQSLCTISFERDSRRPARVDNEAKACLDDVALTMNRSTDSTLVLVGTAPDAEGQNVAAERALHARKYLVDEKGIDRARIQVRTKQADGRSAETILLAPGAVLDEPQSVEVDVTTVKEGGEAYGKPKTRR